MGYSRIARRLRRGLAALGLMGLIAACGAGDAAAAGRPEAPPGSSDTFQDAFLNGCDSGLKDAGWRGWEDKWARDEGRFKTDAEYRKGWVAGYKACYKYGDEHRRTNLPSGM